MLPEELDRLETLVRVVIQMWAAEVSQPDIPWLAMIVLSVLTGGLFLLLLLAVWMGCNDSWACSYCTFVLCQMGGKCPPEKLLGRRRQTMSAEVRRG